MENKNTAETLNTASTLDDLQARRHAIVSAAFDAYIEIDSRGQIASWNPQAESLFGWSTAKALGKKFLELMIAPAARNECWDTLSSLLRSAGAATTSRRINTTTLHREGYEFPIEMNVILITLGDERYAGIYAYDPSISMLIEEEAARRKLFLLDQLGEACTEVDLRGRCTYLNRSLLEIFGHSYSTETIGESYKALLSPEIATLIKEAYTQAYRTRKPAKIEYSRPLADGRTLFAELSVSLRTNSQGKPIGFTSILHDVTDREQVQIELAKSKEAAEIATKAKSEFLANMSHEIRTPLNGAIGMLDLLRDTSLTPEQQEMVNVAAESANSLLMVINDILDYSKIEAGKLVLEPLPFNLHTLLSSIVSSMTGPARSKGLRLAFHLNPDVPCDLRGDSHRLGQVLLNLIGNAIKFTQQGEVLVSVKLQECMQQELKLGISVRDTGIGISCEKQPLIFDAFAQADSSSTRKYGGTGLGLAISSHLVKLMRGEIGVQSKPGEGSIFHLTVPLSRLLDQPETPKSTPVNAQSFPRSLRILVAEDDLANQKLTSALLKKKGHHVYVVSNGEEALQALARGRFDLVLMDIEMPEMDGLAATAAIRSGERISQEHIPIIVLTAHSDAQDKKRILRTGVDDCLSKPIQMEEFAAAAARLLNIQVGHTTE